MRHIIGLSLLFFLLFGQGLQAEDSREIGIAVLFDNSASMTMYFNRDLQLADARELIVSLLFDGTYDHNKWELSGQCTDLEPLWKDTTFMYVHAFGDVTKKVYPFFKNEPHQLIANTADEARNFLENKIFAESDFEDDYTNIELAKMLSWWKISNDLSPTEGRNLYMNVLLVTDNIPDSRPGMEGVGLSIEKAFNESGISVVSKCLFLHKDISARNPDLQLRVQYYTIGPHFIKSQVEVPTDTVIPKDKSKDFIRLVFPENSKSYSQDADDFEFRWKLKGEFESVILNVYHSASRRKILEMPVTGRNRIPVNIEQQLLSNLPENMKTGNIQLYAWLQGVYPEENTEISMINSNRTSFILKKGASLAWIPILFSIAGLGGLTYWFYRSGLMSRGIVAMKRRFGSGDKDLTNENEDHDEENW